MYSFMINIFQELLPMWLYVEIHGTLGTRTYVQLTTETTNCNSLCKFQNDM